MYRKQSAERKRGQVDMAPEAVEPNPQVMTHGHEDATMGVWGGREERALCEVVGHFPATITASQE